MIRIEKITPLKQKKEIKLSDIENEFFRKTGLYYKPKRSIDHSVANGNVFKVTNDGTVQLLNRPLLPQESAFVLFIQNNYREIITGKPQQLQDIIDNHVPNNLFGNIQNGKFESNDFGKAILKTFGYQDHFRSQQTKGKWYGQQLNIKSCPYCNSQYTLAIHDKTKGILTKFQFDHFYSKTRYPFLSISMYNLVPSCAACNQGKGNIETSLKTHYNPYSHSIAARSVFKLLYKPDVTKISIGDVSKLNLKIDFRQKYKQYIDYVNNHDSVFDIRESYQRHEDIVEDLLYKAIVYNSSFKKDMMKIKGLFKNNDRIYNRYLIGNYSKKEEILKRPLAKFTQDIAKQLEIIK